MVCGVWRVKSDVWCVAFGELRVTCGVWRVTCDNCGKHSLHVQQLHADKALQRDNRRILHADTVRKGENVTI